MAERVRYNTILPVPKPQQITELRDKVGMTLGQFASTFGFNHEDVVQWEKGPLEPDQRDTMVMLMVKRNPVEAVMLLTALKAMRWE